MKKLFDSTVSERAVGFVDIVGWKDAFKTIGHEGLLKVAINIAKHKKQFSPEKKAEMAAWDKSHSMDVLGKYYEINFSFISDCFVVSAPTENLEGLLNVIKWDCMCLIADHGFLTRGGISMGPFTHDTENDIALGLPLNEVVDLEKDTNMPRIQLSNNIVRIANHISHPGLVYNDGEYEVLNIANKSKDWLYLAMGKIDKVLASSLDEHRKLKWHYLREHLPKMSEQVV